MFLLNAGIYIQCGGTVDSSVSRKNVDIVHFSAKDGDDTWVLGVAVVAGDGDFLVEGAGTVAPLELSILSFLFSVLSLIVISFWTLFINQRAKH